MKIRRIECLFLFAPFERKLGNSLVWFHGKSSTIVRIETDEGLVGYGEAFGFKREQLYPIVKELFPQLKGFSFEMWEELEEELKRRMNGKVSYEIQMCIVSALNLAYWDIRGKQENLPLCELFDYKPKKEIPVYGTGLFYREVSNYKEQLPLFLEEIKGFIDLGYHGIKMKAGKYPAEEEAWLIEQVRKVLPPAMELMVDANCGMGDMEETNKLIQRLKQIGVKWFEEPFSPDHYEKYKEICSRNNQLDIAAGENECTWDGFRKLVDSGVSILQPELSLCGGFSMIPNLIGLARQHDLQLTPHVWGSGILYSAALHFYSILGPEHILPFECPFLADPLRDDCFHHIRIDQGYIQTPSLPGLGIELNQEEFEQYIIQSV